MNRYDQLMANALLTKLRVFQFLIAIAIYIGLLLAPDPQLGGNDTKNFFLHALGNFLLMMSTWVASGDRFKAMGPALFVIPFSLLVELAQGLTSNRTPEIIDVGANLVGVIAGYIVCVLAGRIIIRSLRQMYVAS